MSHKISLLFLLVSLTLSACGTLEVRVEQRPVATIDAGQVATIVAATLAAYPTLPHGSGATPQSWKTYSNPAYAFSIDYPAGLAITSNADGSSLYIGDQINILIGTSNPLDCKGDCPLIEHKAPATVAGLQMTQATGTIGSVGGNIPQRYETYILQRDNRYYSFTLMALGLHPTVTDPSTIWPLKADDTALFERIMATLKFTN